MTEPKKAFTPADLTNWLNRQEALRPATPSIPDCLTAPELVGFSGRARKRGATLALALSDGHTVTVTLDPVAAQNLIEELREAGRVCGWLDGKGAITFPPE